MGVVACGCVLPESYRAHTQHILCSSTVRVRWQHLETLEALTHVAEMAGVLALIYPDLCAADMQARVQRKVSGEAAEQDLRDRTPISLLLYLILRAIWTWGGQELKGHGDISA